MLISPLPNKPSNNIQELTSTMKMQHILLKTHQATNMSQYISTSEFYLFCKNYNNYILNPNKNTLVTDIAGYGDCTIDFLEAVDKEFGVNFEEFDFKKYFVDEVEIARSVFRFGWGLRTIEKEMTLGELYEYIIHHRT